MQTKIIGKKISEARKKLHISQAEVASRLFISPQAVGKWERGESMPDITTFERLADILEVDLNYFSKNFDVSPPEYAGRKPLNIDSKELPGSKETKSTAWDMSHGHWVDADFSGLGNLNDTLHASNMQRCGFNESNLSGLVLKQNHIEACNFDGANLDKSQIMQSNLLNNSFQECSLHGVDFSGSNMDHCDFYASDFTGATFAKNYFHDCDFRHSKLQGVSFKDGVLAGLKQGKSEVNKLGGVVWKNSAFFRMQLTDLIFTGEINDCRFEDCRFTRVTFRQVLLRHTFFKNNRNLKNTVFESCKADRLTYEFLKQGKANLEGIAVLTD